MFGVSIHVLNCLIFLSEVSSDADQILSRMVFLLHSAIEYTVISNCLNSGSPYTDDALSSKKLLPGFNAKSAKTIKTSPWASRLKNTKESVHILFQMIHVQFANTAPGNRKKLTKLQIEQKAEVTALACNLGA